MSKREYFGYDVKGLEVDIKQLLNLSRELERFNRMTLLYQHDQSKSYVCLMGKAVIVEDVELKRLIWTPSYDRWNTGGPENPATVFVRLVTDRIEL